MAIAIARTGTSWLERRGEGEGMRVTPRSWTDIDGWDGLGVPDLAKGLALVGGRGNQLRTPVLSLRRLGGNVTHTG